MSSAFRPISGSRDPAPARAAENASQASQASRYIVQAPAAAPAPPASLRRAGSAPPVRPSTAGPSGRGLVVGTQLQQPGGAKPLVHYKNLQFLPSPGEPGYRVPAAAPFAGAGQAGASLVERILAGGLSAAGVGVGPLGAQMAQGQLTANPTLNFLLQKDRGAAKGYPSSSTNSARTGSPSLQHHSSLQPSAPPAKPAGQQPKVGPTKSSFFLDGVKTMAPTGPTGGPGAAAGPQTPTGSRAYAAGGGSGLSQIQQAFFSDQSLDPQLQGQAPAGPAGVQAAQAQGQQGTAGTSALGLGAGTVRVPIRSEPPLPPPGASAAQYQQLLHQQQPGPPPPPPPPQAVVVYCRSPEERALNLERLNLDRRKLTVIPVLEGEERLKLLNFQNNAIAEIANLINLPALIFLDLYNNRIARIQHLESVPSLRVLMLGKNCIEAVEGLECLPRLDVLDLHSNSIARIESLQHLRELRVLNLAGNRITAVEGVAGLDALTEINLRRNQIDTVRELDQLPALQRVFLSNNAIRSLDAIECILRSKALMELALDGNPLCSGCGSGGEGAYRSHVIDRVRTLRHLDLKRVSEEERRSAAALARQDERKETLNAIRQTWEAETASASAAGGEGGPTSHPAPAPPPPPLGGSTAKGVDVPSMLSADPDESTWGPRPGTGAGTGAVAAGGAAGGPGSAGSARKSLLEVDQGVVSVYGAAGATEAAEFARHCGTCEGVSFKYVSHDRITAHFLPKLRKAANVRALTLLNNNMDSLGPLNKLAAVLGHTTRELTVQNNPVTDMCRSLFRAHILHTWPMLTSLNGAEVTQADRDKVTLLYAHLRRMQATHSPRDASPSPYPGPGPAAGPGGPPLSFAGAANVVAAAHALSGRALTGVALVAGVHDKPAKSADVAASYVAGVFRHATTIDAKIAVLNREWEHLVQDIVRQTVLEMQQALFQDTSLTT